MEEAKFLLTLTHAGNRQQVQIYLPSLFGFYFSEATKQTLLFSTGQSVIPVLESPHEVSLQIERMSKQSLEGGVLQRSSNAASELPIQGYGQEGTEQGGRG